MNIKLVVWDWNGTILNDTRAVLEAANASEVPLLNLPPVTLQQMRESYEVPIAKAYENLGVDPDVFRKKSAEIGPLFHKNYEPLVAKSRTRPGSSQLLHSLKRRRVNSVILSNHTVEGIYFQLSRLKLGDHFDDVLANDDALSSHHTGKQHRLETYLQNKHYAPSEVVIIGDTPEEVKIGRSLGLHTVSISGGMCSRARLVAAKPDYLISSIQQASTIIEGLA